MIRFILLLLLSTNVFASTTINPGAVSTGTSNTFTADQNFTNLSASGTVTTSGFEMSTGASNGFVLTTDGEGTGTWQAAGGGVSVSADNTWTGTQVFNTIAINTSATIDLNGGIKIPLCASGDVLTSQDGSGNMACSTPSVAGASGFTQLAIGDSNNCKVSADSTQLTITPSISGVCSVGAASSVGGDGTTLQFANTITLTFGGTSDTDGNGFGLRGLLNPYDSAMPLIVGVVNAGTNFGFTLSRVAVRSTGTAGQICVAGGNNCDAQSAVMFLDSSINIPSMTSAPMTWLGWIKGTITSDQWWTFTTDSDTGFNDKIKQFRSAYVDGVMGNSAGKFADDFAGTAPVFATNDWEWSYDPDKGTIEQWVYLDGDGGTDGTGGNDGYSFCGPYDTTYGRDMYYSIASAVISGSALRQFQVHLNANQNCFNLHQQTSGNIISAVNWSDFPNGARTIKAQFEYQIVD